MVNKVLPGKLQYEIKLYEYVLEWSSCEKRYGKNLLTLPYYDKFAHGKNERVKAQAL